jgi:sulfate adenylyltransferase
MILLVATDHTKLISPYGGTLVNLLVRDPEADALKEQAAKLPSVTLTDRQLCDLEMLATGAFSPVTTFMSRTDLESCLTNMRLTDGTLFPVPITLPVPERHEPGDEVALRDSFGNLLAVMKVVECFEWDPVHFAEKLLGSNDPAHNLVREMRTWGKYNLSGPLKVIAVPSHKDFTSLRLTPRQVRDQLAALSNPRVVAFTTRNPINRATEEMTKRAAQSLGATLLIHPVVGMTKPGDVDHITRVRCYKTLVDAHYPKDRTLLSLLPLAMRMAGPREAVWHAIIRRNYGVSHFISGRDHAGPGANSQGQPFFGEYEARDLAVSFQQELGVTIVSFSDMLYLPDEDRYAEADTVPADTKTAAISGTQIRTQYLAKGMPLPKWYARPEVAKILADSTLPQHKQGFCLWFTGLSGSGKSTIAQSIEAIIAEQGRRITMLDGDIVRQNLSKGLGFSREDRDTNVKRVGFVAQQVVYHHGVAICALISPFEQTRKQVRCLFDEQSFIEIYVSTPLEICEKRDPKGHYSRSRHGKMANFTGVDSAYEPPANPDITIDTTLTSVAQSVRIIVNVLERRGFLIPDVK